MDSRARGKEGEVDGRALSRGGGAYGAEKKTCKKEFSIVRIADRGKGRIKWKKDLGGKAGGGGEQKGGEKVQ